MTKSGNASPNSAQFTRFDVKQYLCRISKENGLDIDGTFGKKMDEAALIRSCRNAANRVNLMTNRVMIRDVLRGVDFEDLFKKVLEEAGGLD